MNKDTNFVNWPKQHLLSSESFSNLENGGIEIKDKLIWEDHFKRLLHKVDMQSTSLPATCSVAFEDMLISRFWISLAHTPQHRCTDAWLGAQCPYNHVWSAWCYKKSQEKQSLWCGWHPSRIHPGSPRDPCGSPHADLQLIFTTSFPDEWSVGIIPPTLKKDDEQECNNYWGVTISICFIKAVCHRLNKRLMEWTEKHI